MKGARIWIGFMLLLSLCACAPISNFQSIEKVDQSKIERVAIATFFHDLVCGLAELSLFQIETFPATPVNWESNERAERIIQAELNEAGMTAIIVSDTARRIKLENIVDNKNQFEIEIAKELSQLPSFENVDIFIIVTPNVINSLGQEYNAFSDFILCGPIGLAVGAATKDEAYQPTFMFRVYLLEPASCMISYDLSVIDGKAFKMIGHAKSVRAKEEVPSEIWASSYATMLSDDQSLLCDRCLLGLEKSLQETLRKLEMILTK